jgi:transposase
LFDSPHLNPIEHLWDKIQRRLNEEQPSPTTAAELSVAFQRVWALIPIAFINRLVNSMYRRCAAVINCLLKHTGIYTEPQKKRRNKLQNHRHLF